MVLTNVIHFTSDSIDVGVMLDQCGPKPNSHDDVLYRSSIPQSNEIQRLPTRSLGDEICVQTDRRA